jgi:hypothetical protein
MATRRARISDRIRLELVSGGPDGVSGRTRPRGVNSSRWILIGPVWLRLGRRSSWAGEYVDAEMIEPVEPGS